MLNWYEKVSLLLFYGLLECGTVLMHAAHTMLSSFLAIK
jgi:hypothetical protein